jgi:hypothetical protein
MQQVNVATLRVAARLASAAPKRHQLNVAALSCVQWHVCCTPRAAVLIPAQQLKVPTASNSSAGQEQR